MTLTQAAGAALLMAIALQVQTPAGPRMPYEDVGACPGEGCVYREWTARSTVAVRRDRTSGAPVLFSLKKGEKAKALTGVVVTTRPGIVRFRESVELGYYDVANRRAALVRIEPAQTLYLLTYRGEGTTLAWLNGRLYDEVDGSTAFFNDKCNDANRCAGKIVQEAQVVWWVQLRNSKGQVGWTSQPEEFDGKDAIADGR
jgi:hypothetical protein